MDELNVESRKIKNRASYYFAEVISKKDQKKEILFVNKEPAIIGPVDIEKLATYAEKVRAPRSILMTLGEISKEAEKEGNRRGVLLVNGSNLVGLIRKAGIEEMILKDFAMDRVGKAPPTEDSSIEGQMMLGVELMQAGNYGRSIEHFDRAIATDPGSEIPWRLKGNALERLGQHAKALECYARALELRSDSSELWYSIGATMYSLGRYDEELEAYDKALKINPKHEDALTDKGDTLLKLKRFPEALEVLDKAIKINPRSARNHNNRGIVLINLKKPEDAVFAFDDSISIEPEFPDAWLNKGRALAMLEKYEEALKCFDHLATLRPDSSEVWQEKGEMESRIGKSIEAIRSIEIALELDPTNSKIRRMLDSEKKKVHGVDELTDRIASLFGKTPADVARKSAETKEITKLTEAAEAEQAATAEMIEAGIEAELPVIAEESILPVITIEDTDLLEEETDETTVGVAEEVFGDAAELMILMRRPEIALDELDKGLRLEPISVRMLILRGMALHAIGKTQEALKTLRRAVEIEPACSEAIYSIEYMLSSQKKYQEAGEALAPLLDERQWMPEILAAMDSAAAGKMKDVAEHLESAVSFEPSATAWNYKGILDLEAGEFEKAIEIFERARELEHVFSDPSNNIGVAYSKLGNIDDAGKYYDLAVSAQPKNSVSWNNRGALLASQGRYKEAITCFEQSLLLKEDPLVQINKGFALLEMDNLNAALKSFDESLKIKETAEAYNNKGIVLVRMDRVDKAVECFRKALKLSPDFEDAKKNLKAHEGKVPAEEKKHKAEEPVELPPKTPKEVWDRLGAVDRYSLRKMKKSELEEFCVALGLDKSGTKRDLMDRIISAHKKRET